METAEKEPVDGAQADGQQALPLGLEGFRRDPVKGAQAILRLQSKEKIGPVLSNADFAAGLKKLASDAALGSRAAVALSKFVIRPEFFDAAAAAVNAAGSWTEPSNFGLEDRRLAADALERLRPSWGLRWLAQAMMAAGDRSPALRRYFASRLILVSGGLLGAVDALAAVHSGIKPKAQLSLIRELRDCARPPPSGARLAAYVTFAQSVSGASGHDGAQLKQEVAQLLSDAASADRGLLLDKKFVGLAATLDAELGAMLKEEAKKLVSDTQTTLMGEAAWSDADEALGRALRDMGALGRSFERLESIVEGEAAERTRRARNASNFVLQWVEQAARRRSIKALNAIGDRVQFDPALHALDDEAAPGDYVRVVKPSIVRGDGAQQVVLLRGEVELE